MIRSGVFGVVFLSAMAFFGWSTFRLAKSLFIGRKDDRFQHAGPRLKNVMLLAFGQSKLLREPLAGLLHFFIFWGFVILLTAVGEAIVEGFLPGFTLDALGPLFPPLAILQESVAVMVIVCVIIAFARWYLFPPKRYFGPEITGHVRMDATLILSLIFTIIVSMLGVNATRMVLSAHFVPARFASLFLSRFFSEAVATRIWFEAFWWIHILFVLGFLNYLPYSKHLHVLTSIPNVYFSSLRPRGELSMINLEDENAEKFGANDVTDLTWKQLLDGYTCTDCGRCTSVCPANITGKPLSPRKIIMNIRQRTSELAPILLAGQANEHQEVVKSTLLDNFILEEELWACTTCGACMQECPVLIEHVPAIIDMRRYLVLTESRFPQELTVAFKNLESNYSPWAFSPESRTDWAKGLNVPVMAETREPIDYLFWVGCAGAYDMRYAKVSRAMIKLLNASGIRFAILGAEERCTGDAARRSGNEYLAQVLITENVATLNKYKTGRIVTACPHCYNTLKNEYPQFGGEYEVLHHTELLHNLLRTGRLRVRPGAKISTTFHDSCYAGRYNGIYEAPRAILASAGAHITEMPRSRDRGFCCGAGGAGMYMEEPPGKRVNEERIREALSLNPQLVATACPFCMTMLSDGLKAKDSEESVQIKDVAEVLADSIV